MEVQENNIARLGTIVALSIQNDRENLIDILKQSAFFVPDFVSDEDLVELTVNALSQNETFKNKFYVYVTQSDQFANNTGSNFWSGFNASAVGDLVSGGLSLFGTIKTADANSAAIKANAKVQLQIAQANASNNQSALEIARLQLEAAKLKPADNTALYVVLGLLGLIVIGGGAVFLMRKKS